jgi:hypothetical protein
MTKRPTPPPLTKTERDHLAALITRGARALNSTEGNRLLRLLELDTADRQQERRTAGGIQNQVHQLRQQLTDAETKLATIAAVFEGFGRLLVTSSRDWGEYRVDAWLYAVICGWDCDRAEHDGTCTHGALEEVAELHGWDAEAVAKARRYHDIVRSVLDGQLDHFAGTGKVITDPAEPRP